MIERIGKWFKRDKPAADGGLNADHIPAHVAIIMDGNGRWAKSKGLPRIAGHHSGMKTVKNITVAANDIGVKILTLYAFSTENWKRPKEEVDFLMKLPQEFLSIHLQELIDKNVRVRMMGWPDQLPEHTLTAVRHAIAKTESNTGLILNFALNYGSRNEILQGMQAMARDVRTGAVQPEQITEQLFETYLQSRGYPDPDLLIRTSGEQRISNFMLWQLAYTELYFSEVYWPAFTEQHFYDAISEYQRRSRRYGGI